MQRGRSAVAGGLGPRAHITGERIPPQGTQQQLGRLVFVYRSGHRKLDLPCRTRHPAMRRRRSRLTKGVLHNDKTHSSVQLLADAHTPNQSTDCTKLSRITMRQRPIIVARGLSHLRCYLHNMELLTIRPSINCLLGSLLN